MADCFLAIFNEIKSERAELPKPGRINLPLAGFLLTRCAY